MATSPSNNGSPKKASSMKRAPQPYVPTCTHLTMTRLYTTDYGCTICGHLGAFGWLYRCTQDRELLLEEDDERGLFGDCTKPGGIFERSISPLPRSPDARLDKLAFLTEVTREQFSTYTPDQVRIILEQRAKVLDVAKAHSRAANQPIPEIFVTHPSSPGNTPPTSPPLNCPKPWIPIPGGECQFKCCHRCRPYCRDRAYLSLVGVAKSDIPMTAITGFGFHMARKLPIGNVEHAKNLGLRPSLQSKPVRSFSRWLGGLAFHSNENDEKIADKKSQKHTRNEYEEAVGALGITDGIPRNKFAKKESRTSWPTLTAKTPAISSGNKSTAKGSIFPSPGLSDQDRAYIGAFLENLQRTSTNPNQGTPPDINHAATGPNGNKPDDGTPHTLPQPSMSAEGHAAIGVFLENLRRASTEVQDTDNDSAKTLTNDDPLPPVSSAKILRRNSTPPVPPSQAPFDHSTLPNPLTSNSLNASFPKRTLRPKPNRSNLNLALAITTPLPSETVEEIDDIEARRPLTPMEAKEANQGVFGKLPLEVGDGVAVMEEGVGGHFADLMDCDEDIEGEGKMGIRVVEKEVEVGMNGNGVQGEEINGLQIQGLENLMTQF